jgi:chromosome segregation ATPase
LIEVGKQTSQEQIDAAAQKAHDYLAESKKEFEALLVDRNRLKNEISDLEAKNKMANEGIAKITFELKKMEETKHKAQVDLDLERERIRSAQEELCKQLAVQTTEKQTLSAEIESFLSHFNKIKSELSEEKSEAQKELQRCKQESLEAVQMKEQAEYILDQHNAIVKELKKTISSLHYEHTNLAARINAAKDEELKEREEMRNKLNIEYFKRRELEENWFAQNRQSEHDQKQKEQEAKHQLESERLVLQARKISEKLEPLLAIELTSFLSEEQLETLTPQLEKLVTPAVQHCVQEEYDFRRENWQYVRPPVKKSAWPTWRGHKLPLETQDLKILGVTTLSFLVILAAVFGMRSNNQPQARSISSQGQTIVYSK